MVPDECKITKLKPLYKKGKKTHPENYRPISLLPVIFKILEKVIHDRTMDFLIHILQGSTNCTHGDESAHTVHVMRFLHARIYVHINQSKHF